MKTVELSGMIVSDVGAVWHDLLKKGFDVESVGVTADCTYVYLADDEEKDPRTVVESMVGKPTGRLSKSQVDERRKDVLEMVVRAKEQRAVRAAERAKAEAREKERAGAVPDAYFQTPAVEQAPAPAAAAAAAPPKGKLLSRLFKVFRS